MKKEFKHLKTFEQFIAKEPEIVEEGLFGFGEKEYILDDKFIASKDAEKFTKAPAYAKNVAYLKNTLIKHLGMDDAEAAKAVDAVATFTKGASPLLNKYNLTFDKESKKFVINPNGKGLFNGHPVMG